MAGWSRACISSRSGMPAIRSNRPRDMTPKERMSWSSSTSRPATRRGDHARHGRSGGGKRIFIPFTVGGGIRSVEDAGAALRAGADKIAVNTAAVRDPELVRRLSDSFGAQCVVAAVDVESGSQPLRCARTAPPPSRELGRPHQRRTRADWARWPGLDGSAGAAGRRRDSPYVDGSGRHPRGL